MGGRGRPEHPDILTPREWEVLDLLREDLTNTEIGERIGISERGVKYHVSEIIGKLGVRDRRGAARWRPDAQEMVRKAPLWAPIATPWRQCYRRSSAFGDADRAAGRGSSRRVRDLGADFVPDRRRIAAFHFGARYADAEGAWMGKHECNPVHGNSTTPAVDELVDAPREGLYGVARWWLAHLSLRLERPRVRDSWRRCGYCGSAVRRLRASAAGESSYGVGASHSGRWDQSFYNVTTGRPAFTRCECNLPVIRRSPWPKRQLRPLARRIAIDVQQHRGRAQPGHDRGS